MKNLFNYAEHVAGELRRMLAKQKELPVESCDYAELMRNMEVLARTSDLYSDIADFLAMAEQGITEVSIEPEGRMEEDETEDQESTPTDAEPAPELDEEKQPDPEPTPASDEKTYEMTDVRAALVNARRNGTNVTELLKEFGVENFSAFPAGRYGELMRRLGAA